MKPTDTQLIERYLDGDERALEELVALHLRPIYAFAYGFCHDPDEASDLAQQIFVKAWKGLGGFDRSRTFRTWLFAIARNAVTDWLRRKKSISFSTLDTDEEAFGNSIADQEPLPEEALLRQEDLLSLESALAGLSPETRAIIHLHDVEGLTFEDVADIVGKPMNTVKSQYRRAVLALMKRLA